MTPGRSPDRSPDSRFVRLGPDYTGFRKLQAALQTATNRCTGTVVGIHELVHCGGMGESDSVKLIELVPVDVGSVFTLTHLSCDFCASCTVCRADNIVLTHPSHDCLWFDGSSYVFSTFVTTNKIMAIS